MPLEHVVEAMFSAPGISQYYSLQHPLQHLNGLPSKYSTYHGPSCLTAVISRELLFPTWYSRSFLKVT